jgi:hypothetical protein
MLPGMLPAMLPGMFYEIYLATYLSLSLYIGYPILNFEIKNRLLRDYTINRPIIIPLKSFP